MNMLTAKQVAALLNVPKKTLYEEYRHWGLETYKVGRGLRFPEQSVMSWLKSRRVA